jgi:hypothetical protein
MGLAIADPNDWAEATIEQIAQMLKARSFTPVPKVGRVNQSVCGEGGSYYYSCIHAKHMPVQADWCWIGGMRGDNRVFGGSNGQIFATGLSTWALYSVHVRCCVSCFGALGWGFKKQTFGVELPEVTTKETGVQRRTVTF